MWREKVILLIGQNPYSWLCKHLDPVLPIFRLEDIRDMLALSLKGSSWPCLLARQCLSPLSFDLSQPPQAYVSAGKHCILSRTHRLWCPSALFQNNLAGCVLLVWATLPVWRLLCWVRRSGFLHVFSSFYTGKVFRSKPGGFFFLWKALCLISILIKIWVWQY